MLAFIHQDCNCNIRETISNYFRKASSLNTTLELIFSQNKCIDLQDFLRNRKSHGIAGAWMDDEDVMRTLVVSCRLHKDKLRGDRYTEEYLRQILGQYGVVRAVLYYYK